MTGSRSSAPPPSLPYPPGSILAGKYRVERLLGEGGMGWVVLATHLHLDQKVALKFMHASLAAASSEAITRFLREARAAARIESDFVARVSDVGTLDNGAPYLVMEYLEGEDLEAVLQRTGRLTPDVAIEVAMQACEGLAAAHAAGIVHRDLKPANLFLANRPDGSRRVKLLDFGISKITVGAEAGVTNTQTLMGSPLYMAPEQMRSTKLVDLRADIWSMGIILYEMLVGRAPFGGDTLPQICARILADPPDALRDAVATIPAALDEAVMRCLEKDPNDRYASVDALADALVPFGPPDASATAERIGRVLGSRRTTRSVRAPGASSPTAPTIASKTSASFGTSSSARAARRRLVPFAVAIGALAVGALAATIVVAMRTTPAAPSPSSAGSAATAFAGASSEPSSAPIVDVARAAEPTPASASASASANPPPAPERQRPVAPAAKPAHAAAPAPAPRPAPQATSPVPTGTSAFGGRD